MRISNEFKELIENNSALVAIAVTIWIWVLSYYLGFGVGEYIGNITNK
ncbi:hypothetical protein [Anaerobacillus alkalilacustris]|nr:hypothetical protein [Anaerobacillus alkalilacustris]